MKSRLLVASVALVLLGAIGVVVPPKHSTSEVLTYRAVRATTTSTSTTTSTTFPPPTTVPVTAPPAIEAPVAAAAVTPPTTALALMPTLHTNAPLVAGDSNQFRGFGAWIDVYDWSNEFTNAKPVVGVKEVNRMADLGVQTLYVQAAHHKSSNRIVDARLLRPIIDQAHRRGMKVVAWYLPTLTDTVKDLDRLIAVSQLGVQGVAVDIESRNVQDVAERTKRLIDLSLAFRQHVPGLPIAACVMPAVVMEVINPNYWPGFPYHQIAGAYDAWMPMSYWTSRRSESPYRDAYRYTAENIDRLRADLHRGDLPVHPVGGIGDASTPADMDGFQRAAAERGALGGSVYDYRTTQDDQWAILQRFRQ